MTAGSGPQPIATFNNTKNQLDGYSYDADGNLTNDGHHSYTYDAESRIIAVDGGSVATYVYDAEGRRVQKTTAAGTVAYVYAISGEQIAEVKSGGGANREEVYAGGKHLATYTNNTTYFNHADWLGTERMRTTVAAASCETIVSLPFGDGTQTTGSCSDASPMHFTGKMRDAETASSPGGTDGLDDFDARYYSSEWGRFISADWSAVPAPVPYANFTNPQTLNLYAIVADNPGTFADLNGHTSGASNQGPTPQFPCSDISGPAGENCWYEEGALKSTATPGEWAEGADGQFDPMLEEQAAEGRALDKQMSLSAAGLAFIERREGLKAKVYPDQAGHATIGYGHKILPGEDFSKGITKADAVALLKNDVAVAVGEVNAGLGVSVSQNQFDALVDLAFNEGPSSVAPRNEMMTAVNGGNVGEQNFTVYKYIHVKGKAVVDQGLVNRREYEYRLYSRGVY